MRIFLASIVLFVATTGVQAERLLADEDVRIRLAVINPAAPVDSKTESNAAHEPGCAGLMQNYDPSAPPLGAIARAWLKSHDDGSSGLVYVPAVNELSFARMEK